MKLKDTVNKVFLKQSARAGLLLVIVAALTLEATGIVQYYFSQKGIKEEATRRAESQLEATKLKIINIIDQAEAAVRNSVWLAQWALEVPDSLYAVSRRIVENNPVIVGSTVALVPGYDKKHPLFSPYCFQAPGETGIHVSSLATEEYNYPEQEWFTKPLELQAGYWSEPYIDVGGGDILMTTYSIPLRDRYGRIAGVLTADISLDWLTDLVGNVQVYPNAYSMMISRSGRIMVCPAESLVMRRTAQEVIADMDDTAAFAGVNRSMIAGERGNATIRYNKDVDLRQHTQDGPHGETPPAAGPADADTDTEGPDDEPAEVHRPQRAQGAHRERASHRQRHTDVDDSQDFPSLPGKEGP